MKTANLHRKTGDERFRRRASWTSFIILCALSVLVARMFHLQVILGHHMRRLSENNRIRIQSVNPHRGLILDAAGRVVAGNRPAFDVYWTPADARDPRAAAALLADYLGIPVDEVLERAAPVLGSPKPQAVRVAEDVGRDVVGVLEAHAWELAGVRIEVGSMRYYPFGPAAAHLVGYVAQVSKEDLAKARHAANRPGDRVGKIGVEKLFGVELSGKHGGRLEEVDARGRPVSVMRSVPPLSGCNVRLTLDMNLQKDARRLMAGKSGALVALDPNTGRVLALVSEPSFDPNWFVGGLTSARWDALVSDLDRPLQNKALAGEYPPGSVYKIVTALAALEEGVAGPGTVHFCPGDYEYGDRHFRCWRKGGHGTVSLARALAESCDVYFYKVGERLGVDRLAFYASGCGLGQVPGLGLASEARGLVPTAAWKKRRTGQRWVGGETLSLAIGQGFNLVTPLQAAVLIAAVANGGTVYKPLLAYSVERPDGHVLTRFTPQAVGSLPVSARNLDLVRQGLCQAVNGPAGTARVAALPGVEICGKTGTAQVVGRKDREKFLNETDFRKSFKDHAWFVAYAPAEAPRIAVAVLVEHGEHGASTAAPIAREVIARYLGVEVEGPPEYVPGEDEPIGD
ncbi:MAG: penicillin-binding protein 2 [Pseudomonadota bacterium]